MISAHTGIKGQFRIEAFREDENGIEINGSRRVLADWFDNMILNGGLASLKTAGPSLGACVLGTGSAAPTAAQTSLVNQVVLTTTRTNSNSANPEPPYDKSTRYVYRVNPGSWQPANLSEVGICIATSSNALFSRALITAGGSPITVTVLPGETLDVVYVLRKIPSRGDVTGTIILDGNSYDWLMRPSSIATDALTPTGGLEQAAYATTYSGDIGPETGVPSGMIAQTLTMLANTDPTPNQGDRTAFVAVNQSNAPIRSVRVNVGGIQSFQIQFTPPIPKTDQMELRLRFGISWGRA